MTSIQVMQSLQVFSDKNGLPLDGGYIYIGKAGQNPETTPVAVYYDSALTQPAPQPLRTINGYISRQGSPDQIYASEYFSITVRNYKQELVYTELQASPISFALAEYAAKLQSSSGASLVGFVQAGVGSIVRTLQERERDTMHLSDKGETADALAALNSVATDFASGGSAYIPKGDWTLPGSFTFAGQRLHLIGDGQNLSNFVYDSAASGVALKFDNGTTGGIYQGRLSGLGFKSSNTIAKTAISLVNCADFVISHIGIPGGAWQGDSIGIRTYGRQSLSMHNCEISCARPLVISPNATWPALAADHFLVWRCELSSTSSTRPVIEFESGVSFATTTLRNLALTGGKDGILWNDTTSSAASFQLLIEQFRTEQGADPSGWSVNLASTVQVLQSLEIRDAVLDSARNGIRLRNVQRIILENVDMNMGAGKAALDIVMVPGSRLSIKNCFVQSGATVSITNGRCIRKEINSGLTINEEWIYDTGFSASEERSDVYHGGTPFTVSVDGTQAIADNTFTGFVMVSTSEDASAMYALTGPTTVAFECVDPAGQFSAAKDTASSTNIYWDASTSRYVIQNKRSVPITYSVYRIGTSS